MIFAAVLFYFAIMGRAINTEKKEFAFILYMNGELQKNICERVGITPVTLGKWIDKDKWKERRAAKTISKAELINKALQSISNLLDQALDNKDDPNAFNNLSDRLSKIAKTITSLEKGNTVINDMETFRGFISFLNSRIDVDPAVNLDLIKTINRLQDIYVSNKLSKK